MPHPKVKIADNSGNEVAVRDNALDVHINASDALHEYVAHFAVNIRNAGNGGPTQLTGGNCKHVDIMANISNTGIIYIGASGVGVTTGIALYPGDVYSADVSNTNLLYALSITDNDDVNMVIYR